MLQLLKLYNSQSYWDCKLVLKGLLLQKKKVKGPGILRDVINLYIHTRPINYSQYS